MENEKRDWVLIVWILTTLALWQVVFVLNRSPWWTLWWTLLAVYLWYTPTLFKALRKRYGIPEEN